jgi:hypothetical protein
LSLVAGVAISLLAPVVAPETWLIPVLIVGLPAFGTLFAPATALVSVGADRHGLNQGIAFGLANLAWAGGQSIAAAGAGAIAQATADIVPYALLAAICVATLIILRPGRSRLVRSITAKPAPGPASPAPGLNPPDPGAQSATQTRPQ